MNNENNGFDSDFQLRCIENTVTCTGCSDIEKGNYNNIVNFLRDIRYEKEDAARNLQKGINQIIENGKADFVAVAREALFNPMWAAQAAQYLHQDKQFTLWPKQSGWWLERREKSSEFYSPELNSD